MIWFGIAVLVFALNFALRRRGHLKSDRRERESVEQLRAWDDWSSRRKAQGYHCWQWQRPPTGAWIECTRREWNTVKVWQSGNENPYLNIADLWWRPWEGETISGDIIEGVVPSFHPENCLSGASVQPS